MLQVKTNSEFNITVRDVTVVLEINYKRKAYQITPPAGRGGHFAFRNCDELPKAHLWRDVLEAINEANNFAIKELEL